MSVTPRFLDLSAFTSLYLVVLVAFVFWLNERVPWIAFALVVPSVIISIVDLRTMEIPDVATMTIAILGLAHLGLQDVSLAIISFVVGGAIMVALWFLGGLYFRRRGSEALGIGDAKLLGACTLCCGWPNLPVLVFLASSVAAVTFIVSRSKERGLAFGPFICFANFLIVCFDPSGQGLFHG